MEHSIFVVVSVQHVDSDLLDFERGWFQKATDFSEQKQTRCFSTF